MSRDLLYVQSPLITESQSTGRESTPYKLCASPKTRLMVFSHQSKITTRQQQMLKLCIPMMPFTTGPATTRQTWSNNGKTMTRQNEVEPCSSFVLWDGGRMGEGEAAEVGCWSDLFTQCEYPTSKTSLSSCCLVVVLLWCENTIRNCHNEHADSVIR